MRARRGDRGVGRDTIGKLSRSTESAYDPARVPPGDLVRCRCHGSALLARNLECGSCAADSAATDVRGRGRERSSLAWPPLSRRQALQHVAPASWHRVSRVGAQAPHPFLRIVAARRLPSGLCDRFGKKTASALEPSRALPADSHLDPAADRVSTLETGRGDGNRGHPPATSDRNESKGAGSPVPRRQRHAHVRRDP